ncbi:6-carboxytetrahydropterin synthase [Ferrovum sp. PN-J185]|uniref:6-pyruvoyl trahydropterin synthase family protein n=1 Tax=Ferrovum sp. PN-J185 TaxID=1356306 RepID=UPI00079635F0|nr:6-carboxytetrahydropterin synthase [Ferrovum sp. PN-J185]KXW56245.1 6-carboxy-5,6,7,8-tetrahydropterin synthase [Ferrovum sp. PN-J185]MCC6068968.1 6-carboxytetrahydropterin synthase [Ferrovum sp. PN-J185]MDE1891052.1 6-carboxytetrahydropterin synthase [Betaproteobacteria bacterium]MDE2055636.1 6-carboxytetrahydropterin synthase [Betaproteobacteria bacterium]
MVQELYLSSAGFEAARHSALTEGAKPILHGHSFRVDCVSYECMSPQLTQLCTSLNLTHLNDKLTDTNNESLMTWFIKQLGHENIKRLQIWSGPHYGITFVSGYQQNTWFRSRFEAAHFLPQVGKDHKCGRLHGHGFEVLIHCALQQYEKVYAYWQQLHNQLHHQVLNEINGLTNPTSEMIAYWIWQQFTQGGLSITEVTVFETRSTGSVFNGRDFYIWKEFSFDSATRLPNSQQIVGHTYLLRVGLSSSLDKVFQWVEDFGDVKKVFSPLMNQLDHQPLQDVFGQGQLQDCLHAIEKETLGLLPKIARVSLWQTPSEGLRRNYSELPTWVE